MRYIVHLAIGLATLFTLGCGLIDAANDVTDDIEDAVNDFGKKEGPESCYSIMESVYSSLDDCSEDSVIGEGETAESLAKTWCDDNCSSLSEKVDLTDDTTCAQEHYSLECDALSAFVDGTTFPTTCSFLDSTLGC